MVQRRAHRLRGQARLDLAHPPMRAIKTPGASASFAAVTVKPSKVRLARPEGLRRDIASAGGQAWIVEGRFHGGLNDTELVDAFTAQRTADYEALSDECRELLSQSAFTPAIQAKVARL